MSESPFALAMPKLDGSDPAFQPMLSNRLEFKATAEQARDR